MQQIAVAWSTISLVPILLFLQSVWPVVVSPLAGWYPRPSARCDQKLSGKYKSYVVFKDRGKIRFATQKIQKNSRLLGNKQATTIVKYILSLGLKKDDNHDVVLKDSPRACS